MAKCCIPFCSKFSPHIENTREKFFKILTVRGAIADASSYVFGRIYTSKAVKGLKKKTTTLYCLSNDEIVINEIFFLNN